MSNHGIPVEEPVFEDTATEHLQNARALPAAQVAASPTIADAGTLDLGKVALGLMEQLSFYGLHLIEARGSGNTIQVAQLEAAMDALNTFIAHIPPLADRFAKLRADTGKIVSFLK